MKVKLTYFKKTGKYYSTGEFDFEPSSIATWHEAIDKVKEMQRREKLPGLIDGAVDFIILVEPQICGFGGEVPHIIFPKLWNNLVELKEFLRE